MDIKSILNQYLSKVQVSNIRWGTSETNGDLGAGITYSSEDQRLIFQEICCHHINKKFPPSNSYQRAFLKHIIYQAESNGHEVLDEIYILFTTLLSHNQLKCEDYCFKSYCIGSEYVTLKESTNLISCGTTGLVTWQASLAFIEWAISSRAASNFKLRRVLELGCGIGFTGISLCLLSDLSGYIFTDCHEAVTERLQENIDINLKGCSKDVKVQVLDWTLKEKVAELLSVVGGPVDYMVATDVVYDCDIIGPLLVAMEILFQFNSRMVIYISSTIRNMDTYQHFTDSLAVKAFKWSRLTDGSRLPFLYYDRTLPIEILEITSPG